MSRKKLVGREVRCSGIEAQDPPQGGDDGRRAAPGPAAIPRRGRTRIKIEYNILTLIEKSTFVTYSGSDDKIGVESALLPKLIIS